MLQKTVKSDMVKDLIKMMKTCCGKVCANKLYCTIATWLWIALQDPDKKFVSIIMYMYHILAF